MNKYIILIVSFILDLVLLNILPFQYQNITYFNPLFMIVSIFLVYNLFNDERKYFITILIFSLLYGALFMNNILLGSFLFLIVAFVTKLYNRYINLNIFTLLLGIIVTIILYDSIMYIVLCCSFVSNFSLKILLYKIKHSIVINIIYSLLLYVFCIKKSSKNII